MKNISHEDFTGAVLKLAKENIDETLRIPGVWEAISEHYNNEAIDAVMEERKEKRRERLTYVLKTPFWQR